MSPSSFQNVFSALDQAMSMNEIRAATIKNKRDLVHSFVPKETKIPTAAEISQMHRWAMDYKRRHHCSDRQARIAVKEHFHIQIIPVGVF